MSSKKRKTQKKQNHSGIPAEAMRIIMALIVIGVSLLGIFQSGVMGVFINSLVRVFFGQYPIIYYVIFILIALAVIFKMSLFKQDWKTWLAVVLLYLSFILVLSMSFADIETGLPVINRYFAAVPDIFSDPAMNAYSGLIGVAVYGFITYLAGREGVYILVGLFVMIALVLIFGPLQLREKANNGTQRTKNIFAKFKREKKDKPEPAVSKPDEKVHAGFMTLEEAAAKQEAGRKPQQLAASIFMDVDHSEMVDDVLPPVTQPSQNAAPSDGTNLKAGAVSSDYSKYVLPSVRLLEGGRGSSRSQLNENMARSKGIRLLEVLKQFSIDAELIDTHIGPAVTKFELKPDSNVKISKISSIQDNLMMELAVKTLRIEAPIPGKSAVGIEIPNSEMIAVRMKDVIQASPDFFNNPNIQVALGKNLMGQPITVSLNRMPHLLVAGATGSGKSVCMNAIITSILLTKKPDELKLLLIDPKKVEFTTFADIPHLMGPVISDPHQASSALKAIVTEMENRYELFSKSQVRNITSYNEKVKLHPEEAREAMPWIVVVIDELADLMAVAGKEVEMSIQRITQLARAAGIHLIVATQRPSVDVVTGIIKANIPSRIAFAVSSAVDSRTILDSSGAEKLLGHGDMLYIPMGEPNAIRVQGVFVSDNEVQRIAQRSSTQAAPRYVDAFIDLDGVEGNHGMIDASDDPLYEEIKQFVLMERKASTSLLQRRFQIGYNRAARMIDILEQNGIIGPAQGSKPRRVLIGEEEE